jgi:DNA-binding XRE family transcriptional regulator
VTEEHRGKLLREAREKLGFSQVDFAAALNVKLSRLQKWERGATEPRFTISEWRRFRALNPEVYEALMSGTVGSLRITSVSMRRGAGKSMRHSDIERPNDPPEDECYLRWVA